MKDIILQKVEINDWEKVAEFEKNADSKVFNSYKKEDEIREYINTSNVFFIILDNIKIGTISYEEKNDNTLHFNGLIVSDNYRGKGIGTKAIEKLLENLDVNKKIDLVVHPQNTPAIIVYLKAGFKIEGWKINFFGDGEDRLYLVKIGKII